MPRAKKNEQILADTQLEAAKPIINKVSPVTGEFIEVKNGELYERKSVDQATDQELQKTHKYYKWKLDFFRREFDKFASKFEITTQEMEFRGLLKEETV